MAVMVSRYGAVYACSTSSVFIAALFVGVVVLYSMVSAAATPLLSVTFFRTVFIFCFADSRTNACKVFSRLACLVMVFWV